MAKTSPVWPTTCGVETFTHRWSAVASQPASTRLPSGQPICSCSKRVGDGIELQKDDVKASYRIVGSVLFPEGDFEHDKGFALSVRAADRLVGSIHDTASVHQLVYDWKEGVNVESADDELRRAGFSVLSNSEGLKPAVVTNLGQIERLPRLFAAFVGLIALISLGHAVALTTRLRRRELATLRAIGATLRTGVAIISFQSLAILLIAVVVGIPIGLAAGRTTWAPIARRAHLIFAPSVGFGWLMLLCGLAAAGAALATVVPAFRAARLRPAEALRTE
jgi:hypothetical protein